jgi:hypothetical protein
MSYIDTTRTDTSVIQVSGSLGQIATVLSTTAYRSAICAAGKDSGKRYFEVKITAAPQSGNNYGGLGDAAFLGTNRPGYGSARAYGVMGSSGRYYRNSALVGYPTGNPNTWGGAFVNSDETVAIAVDLDTGRLWAGMTNAGESAINWGAIGVSDSNPVTETSPLATDAAMIGVAMYPCAHVYYINSVYEFHLAPNEMEFAIPAGFQAWLAEPAQVLAGLEQPYGLFDQTVIRGLEQLYAILAPVSPAALIQPYGLILEAALRQLYGDAATPMNALVARYGDAAQLQLALVQEFGDTVPVLRALDQRYHLMHLALAGLDQPYAICDLPVVAGLEQTYDLRQRQLIQAALVEHYSLFRDADITSLLFAVRVGGVDITAHCAAVTWTIGDDAYLIDGSVTVPSQAVARSLTRGDAVEIDWMGTTYHLYLAVKRRAERAISGEGGALEYALVYVLTLRSLTAGLDAPLALPVTMDWPATILASAIAADLIGSLADIITLDWQCEDWLQPGGTFFVTGETPLEGLRKLAAIIGAELASGPDNRLIITLPDPVPPSAWAAAAPSLTISDNGRIFSDAEEEDERPLYNLVVVGNQGESDESTTFQTEDVSAQVKRVKGFRVPWLDFGLATSGGDWVTIEDEGVVDEQVTETVEFVEGSGRAANPVYSQVAVRWLQTQLGAITASEDGSLVAEVAGQSLAEITYTTRYHAWLGRDDRSEEVQFYEVPR